MQAARILPDLQASLLCEDVRQEASGNFIIVGVIGAIRTSRLPVTAMKLCVLNRWTSGVGGFHEAVRLLAPDQSTAIRQSEVTFKLRDANYQATNVSVFQQVEFSVAGIYYIEVLIDDVMKIRYPLVLTHRPPAETESSSPESSREPGPE